MLNPMGNRHYAFSRVTFKGYKTLVSLMHVNNETGTILDLERIGRICQEHKVLFHSDTVQSIGKMNIDLQSISVDFIVASAHKFMDQKELVLLIFEKFRFTTVVFLVGNKKRTASWNRSLAPNCGYGKSIELSYANLEVEQNHITELKLFDHPTQN
jgi:cysteine desulfurase